jgi:hypothetical protein
MSLNNGVSNGNIRITLGYSTFRAEDKDDASQRLEEVFGPFVEITFRAALVASDIIRISIRFKMSSGKKKKKEKFSGWAESEHRLRNGGTIIIVTYDEDEDAVGITLSPPPKKTS